MHKRPTWKTSGAWVRRPPFSGVYIQAKGHGGVEGEGRRRGHRYSRKIPNPSRQCRKVRMNSAGIAGDRERLSATVIEPLSLGASTVFSEGKPWS